MEEDILKEIIKMNKLLAIMITKDMALKEKVKFLSKAGYQPKEIADITDSTPNSISVMLNKLKKK